MDKNIEKLAFTVILEHLRQNRKMPRVNDDNHIMKYLAGCYQDFFDANVEVTEESVCNWWRQAMEAELVRVALQAKVAPF